MALLIKDVLSPLVAEVSANARRFLHIQRTNLRRFYQRVGQLDIAVDRAHESFRKGTLTLIRHDIVEPEASGIRVWPILDQRNSVWRCD